MRTRLSICRRKQAFPDQPSAEAAAERASLDVRPYRCDRCNRFHLTSRRKGKRIPRPID